MATRMMRPATSDEVRAIVGALALHYPPRGWTESQANRVGEDFAAVFLSHKVSIGELLRAHLAQLSSADDFMPTPGKLLKRVHRHAAHGFDRDADEDHMLDVITNARGWLANGRPGLKTVQHDRWSPPTEIIA